MDIGIFLRRWRGTLGCLADLMRGGVEKVARGFRFWRIIRIFASDMDENKRIEIEGNIVRLLKTVFDPEIPVDIYSLGLIYGIDVDDDGTVHIKMTLTAPSCPASDFLMEDIKMKLESIDGVTGVDVQLVFEPEWTQDMMTEEAKLELGFL